MSEAVSRRKVVASEVNREEGISRSTISEILGDKKPISRSMVRKLAEYFEVAPHIFMANF